MCRRHEIADRDRYHDTRITPQPLHFVTRILCLASLLCLLTLPRASAQVVIRGDVSDVTSGRRLSDVHVLDAASGRGTITNTEGRFEIVLPGLPATVVVRHIGYLTQTLAVGRDSPRVFSVELEPSVVPLDEVVIAGDDLAENVMRKVIQRKLSDWRSVNSWSARAYFRNTLSPTGGGERGADNAVASIRESVFDVYFRRGAGILEVLRS